MLICGWNIALQENNTLYGLFRVHVQRNPSPPLSAELFVDDADGRMGSDPALQSFVPCDPTKAPSSIISITAAKLLLALMSLINHSE